VTSSLGVFLDWTVVDFAVLGIAIWQFISISRDLKQTRAREAREKQEAAAAEEAEAARREASRFY
jgi:large-conductance mechanosensitive channel